MNLSAMIAFLTARGKPSIVSLTTETIPRMLVKSRIDGRPNPYPNGSIVRTARRRSIVGASYAGCVEAQRAREFADLPPFVPHSLWRGKGSHIDGEPLLVEHIDTKERYMPYRPHTVDGLVVADQDEWIDIRTGEVIDAIGSEFFPMSANSRQGVVSTVPWRTVRLDHIVQIRYGAVEYNR